MEADVTKKVGSTEPRDHDSLIATKEQKRCTIDVLQGIIGYDVLFEDWREYGEPLIEKVGKEAINNLKKGL
jgi:hypothetical protein